MTDFRALCEELVDNLHRCQCWYIEDNGYGLPDLAALLRRARAALAEQLVGPTDEDVTELFYRHMGEGSEVGFENAIAEALARWGQP
jgi:hypothetical protein